MIEKEARDQFSILENNMSNRFTKIGTNGQQTEGDDYVAIRAPIFNYETLQLEWLLWDRNYIEVGKYAEAQQKASEVRICGKPGRAPTLVEQLSIADYTRHGPAINPLFNCPKYGRFWTSTLDAEDPSVLAWYVGFNDGDAFYTYHDTRGFVRAVRVGQ